MTGAGTVGAVPAAILPALRARFGALVRELSKFGTVGGIAFAIDLAIFNLLLLEFGFESLLAKAISTVIATTVAFFGNRFWTWRHREHANMARQYTLFFLLNGVGLGIGLTCLAISHYGLGAVWPEFQSPLADNIAGQFVGTAMGTLFRFWAYRRFVFGEAPIAEPGPAGPPAEDLDQAHAAAPQSAPPPEPRAVRRM